MIFGDDGDTTSTSSEPRTPECCRHSDEDSTDKDDEDSTDKEDEDSTNLWNILILILIHGY
jgi:hypothetical protein